jgi:hypothetical protein
MHSVMRTLIGPTGWAIGTVAIVILGVAGVSCSETATRAPEGTTTSIVEMRTSEPTSSTTATDSAEQRCMQFAPSDHRLFFKAATLSIGDIRGIVVATPPPTPTSLLLPGHDSSEQALMCWSTSTDRTSVAQFWVLNGGESQVLCIGPLQVTVPPEQVGNFLCP